MKIKHSKSTTSVNRLDANSPFHVVMLYEDLPTGKRAKETYDYFAGRFKTGREISNSWWKFDVLQIPEVKAAIIRDATKADMVIFAAHGKVDLPVPVKNWIETWLDQKENHPSALVALFDDMGERTYGRVSIRSYLQNVAIRGRMDFFTQPSCQ